VGPAGQAGSQGVAGQNASFTYSGLNVPTPTFDVTDRLTTTNTVFTKTATSQAIISDKYKNYYARNNGYNTNSTVYTFGVNPQMRWVAGGQGGNTLAFSNDGIKWVPQGASIFTTACYDTAWNGYIWVAVGSGTNTVAYSFDGINWTGLLLTVFGTQGTRVLWNNKMFVAVGSGTNSIAYSYDGINWTGLGTTIFTTGNAIGWNGQTWMAGGTTTNSTAISTDGVTWTGQGTATFTSSCNAVLWTGAVWLAGGQSGTTGVLYYSYNNGSAWTQVPSFPIKTMVQGLATNRTRVVAYGADTSGNSLAYSTDIYGTSWSSVSSVFNNSSASNLGNVKWALNKFLAFGQDTTNRIAYSYDGVTWTSASTSTSIFTTLACGGDCATTQPHTVTFPSNVVITGNVVSRDNGNSWSPPIGNIPLSTTAGWNGTQYIFCNASGNITVVGPDLSGATTIAEFTDTSGINVIKWSGSQWLLGGTSTTNKHLQMSYDGINWQTTGSNIFDSAGSCNGITWNGSLWVASGKDTTGNVLAYSYDGVTWAQTAAPSPAGGGPVEWNGSYFLAGGPASSGNATILSQSSDGINWSTPRSIGTCGPAQSIVWNGQVWIVVTQPVDTVNNPNNILVSYDGTTWTATGGSINNALGAEWNGLTFVVNQNTATTRYSYDGTSWTNITTALSAQNGNAVVWSKPHIGTMNIQQPTIVGGTSSYNTMAYSKDGINFTALGNSLFSAACNDAKWNGNLWVAAGEGTNTLAWSYDGLVWTGLGATTFTQAAYGVAWNGNVWLALGTGGNTMATSTDGKTWTGQGTTVFDTSGLSADWNGQAWVAGGIGTTNTLAYSTNANATSWTGLGKTSLSTSCNTVRWMLNKWVIGGAGTNQLWYSTNSSGSSGWTVSLTPNIFGTSTNSIFWNGQIAVAVGTGSTNTIATSPDGITWTGQGINTFTTAGNDVTWNTKRWVAGGQGGNTLAYSINGTTWYGAPNSGNLFSQANGLGTNPRIGATVVPSAIAINTNDRLVVTGPRFYDDSLMSDTAISMNLNLPQ
jgi:hypothetical protein